MDSGLKIKYHIYSILGKRIETNSREEALASFAEGKIVYEIHETTWSSKQWMSGKNEVRYEWHQSNARE